MKVSYVEWPVGLTVGTPVWSRIAEDVKRDAPAVLVVNEMPFGAWLPVSEIFDKDLAARSVLQHEQGLEALKDLGVPLILSSRPVWSGAKLANEGFALVDGQYRAIHHKHYFPAHTGWFESAWFHAGLDGFVVEDCGGLKVAFLICTELMFNEHARSYGRAEADLIVVPRGTGPTVHTWRSACAMAALVSGSYVVSSNRVGDEQGGPVFGGSGLAYAPGGVLIGETTRVQAMLSFDLDIDASVKARTQYPCYVKELSDV